MLSLNKISLSYMLSILINICTAFAQDPTPQSLITRLTHFQSIDSPYFDPTISTKDLVDIYLISSISRALYLTANTSSLLQLTDIEIPLTPGQKNGFLARLRVGSKEVEQLVYMDTGSNLLWINCVPCGLNVLEHIFDPKESLSYAVEDCESSDICDNSGAVSIGTCEDTCPYIVRYGRGVSKGHLARETFKFGISSQTTVKNIVFGCARRTDLNMNGILGLGKLGLSLISQYQTSKFSYCIGNISDWSYAYNTLVIGNKVELWGYVTPLIIEDKYYTTLEGIMIGETSLEFDPQIFRRNSAEYTGGMVIDTGSTFSFIPQVVLSSFGDVVTSLIDDKLDLDLDRDYTIKYKEHMMLCYNGVVTRDLIMFPTVSEKDAIMELTAENIFQQTNDQSFCLAILPSEILGSTISILGNLMQQHFYVAYDLEAAKLSFQQMVCKAVDDYYGHDEL